MPSGKIINVQSKIHTSWPTGRGQAQTTERAMADFSFGISKNHDALNPLEQTDRRSAERICSTTGVKSRES